jgi:hypothetical protein
MTEVLAEHQWYDATTDNEDPATGCTGCPEWFGSEDALDDGSFAAHQAEMLSAAGCGDVREAKAVALEEAAQDFEDNMGVGEFDEWARRDGGRWTHIDDAWEYQGPYMDWLRARAAAVRGEG